MDTAALDELRELRARAYGPAADIDRDPAALRRLRELEARQAGPATVSPATADAIAPSTGSADDAWLPAGPESSPDAAVEAFAHARPPAESRQAPVPSPGIPEDPPAGARPGAADSAAAAPVRGRLRPVTRVLWALSVVAAAALAAGATYALVSMTPVSVSSGAPQIATLEPDAMVQVPSGWFGAGPSSRAFEFYGLTLFETAGGLGPGASGGDCFTVMATEDLPEPGADTSAWSTQGAVHYGCGVGAFPATVQFAVDSNAPEALRSRFTDDSALQFVFDGDRIGVFLDSE